MSAAEMCRKHGLRQGAFYKYKSKYGGIEMSDVANLKALEDGNARLKRLLVDTMLERNLAGHFFNHNGVSMSGERQRSGRCGTIVIRSVGLADLSIARQGIAKQCPEGCDPKTVRLERPPDNPEIRAEMKAIAAKRRRFDNCRIGVMLERKGMTMHHKKLNRLYTEEKLDVRPLRGRKRGGSRTPMLQTPRPGARPPHGRFGFAKSLAGQWDLWISCPTRSERRTGSAS